MGDGYSLWVVIAVALVAFVLGRATAGADRAKTPEAPPHVPDASALDQVRGLLRDDGKIAAIKRYRELTGAGLADAKRAVETLE